MSPRTLFPHSHARTHCVFLSNIALWALLLPQLSTASERAATCQPRPSPAAVWPRPGPATCVRTPLHEYRRVARVLSAPRRHWVGDGFHVLPVFNDLAFSEALSPFLMFDYAAPRRFPPSARGGRRGVGNHPHRGFETVTLAFLGEIEHRDSNGNRGVVKPGDCQWMTAGQYPLFSIRNTSYPPQRGGGGY